MSSGSSPLTEVGRGGLEGLVGTGVMSAVIAASHALGLLTNPPPKQITRRATEDTGVRHDVSPQAFTVGWLAAHVAFGSGVGVAFRFLRPWLPKSPVLAGVLYGSAVWVTSYAGVMPALGLYPWPREDRPSRVAVMIGAHFVYGTVMAAADQMLAPREQSTLRRVASAVLRQ